MLGFPRAKGSASKGAAAGRDGRTRRLLSQLKHGSRPEFKKSPPGLLGADEDTICLGTFVRSLAESRLVHINDEIGMELTRDHVP
jgi:hypothetical protein